MAGGSNNNDESTLFRKPDLMSVEKIAQWFAREKKIADFFPTRSIGTKHVNNHNFISAFVSHTFPPVSVRCLLFIIFVILRTAAMQVLRRRMQRSMQNSTEERGRERDREKRKYGKNVMSRGDSFFSLLHRHFRTCKNAIVRRMCGPRAILCIVCMTSGLRVCACSSYRWHFELLFAHMTRIVGWRVFYRHTRTNADTRDLVRSKSPRVRMGFCDADDNLPTILCQYLCINVCFAIAQF